MLKADMACQNLSFSFLSMIYILLRLEKVQLDCVAEIGYTDNIFADPIINN